MRKFLKYLFITVLVLIGLGYGVYYVGINLASDKLMEALTSQLENSGEMDKIKRAIESDPELRAFLQDAQSVDESTLPFTTKEEAVRLLVQRVGISGLQDIQTKAEQGLITKDELIQEMEQKLTDKEIMALKVIAYKELYH
ncbi:hypothetical protein [Ornithinibacillus sp. FSL M8-0202]|uniref:hypothetical protein n=1 Tax=Ornithinibacillus sp. FSL M8-0202 TaxID=2921616 RepID=UPI0030D3F47D